MKFCVPFLLLLLFDTLQGSTLSHVRKVRSLNTTLQTNFNGTYERRNPCTNAEIESSSYIASHEFHHHTNEDNWSDYTHKCSAIISGFLQAIGNLVRFNNKQNGLFNFHINTSISQKQVGDRKTGKCCEELPTILIEATDCQVTPKTNTEPEGKYDGPVCLLNKRNKAGPRKVPKTASCEQNADKVNPSITNTNKITSQNEFQETEKNLKQARNPLGDISEPLNVKGPKIVPNCIAQPANEQTSAESAPPTTTPPQSEPEVIPVAPSYEPPQPNFGSGNSPGFQATFENANEQENFNPPADIPNMPFAPQPSFSGIPEQPIVPISNEEQINQNQLPPVLPNQQGLPAVYPPQPSNNNLDGQVPGNQMPELLPPSQTEGIPQGGPDSPQDSPAFIPTYNSQNPNLQFPGNYPPPPQQAPPVKSSFELPPTDFNNDASQVGFTKTQEEGQISDMTETVDSFTPDQQQPVKQTETAYYNDVPMNYNQPPTVPLEEIEIEILPPKPLFFPSQSQQKLPEYPSEIATNEQPPMKPTEVLPSDSDSPVIPNGGVGNTINLPVANSFEPVVPSNSQLPIAPALTAPQDEQQYPSSIESTYPSQREEISEFQVLPNQMPGSSEMSDNPPISNQPEPNTFIQPVPVGNIPSSNNFPEQERDDFDGPQQPDSTDLRPVQNIPSQPIPTLGPQSSPDFTQQLPRNEMLGPVPQNFQRTVPVDAVPVQSSPVVGPTNDITSQTAIEDSQFDYSTSTERPEEPSVSGLVPNNIGNQLIELTTNNKPVLNSNDFQPETKSYFTEPSDRNLDYTTQTPFYDSIPATYKSELESQPGLIQNLPERPIAPVPEQAVPPSGLETFPTTPEPPTPAPDVTNTEPYSEQIRPEFGSTPTNPEIVNPPRNGFQMFSRRPNPRFIPREQYFGDDRQTVAMQQPNPVPEISNPLDTNQPPLENNPVVPEQQQPQFYPNQNDIQQPLPETEVTSQNFAQMATQQDYETTRSETNEFPSSVPLQDQRITPAYPQPPIQAGVTNYDVQSGNQASIQQDVTNYNVQPGFQPPVQPDVPNYDVQPGFQPPVQDVPNYDAQSENQAPIQPDVPNYDGQQGFQPPTQPDVPNYDVQPGFQPPVQDVPNYDAQSGNQAPIQPDVPNYDGQPGFQPPTQPDVPNYDVQPGFQRPIQPYFPNYDVQPGNQAPVQPDVQPENQAPIQPDMPNYDAQPGFQPPVQDVPNYDVQPGFQPPVQDVPNYDVQPRFQPPVQDVPNYDAQSGNQAPIQPDVPNYDVQSGNQAPIQPDVPNYDVQSGNQAPIQPDVPNYDVQSGNQAPIQPDVPNYDIQPPVQPDVPNYNGQPGFLPPAQDVPNYDIQSGNQAPIQPDVPNYNGQPGFLPPAQDVPNYDVQSGNQAPIQPDVPNYDIQPPVQPDVPNYNGQPGFQPPVQPDVPNYEIQPGNQPPSVAAYYPEGRSEEFYREPPQSENQPFQADSQTLLPYQPPSTQIPSAESQEQIINTETASAESVSNVDLVSTVPPAALGAGNSLPNEYSSVEQQSAGFDGPQMPQQNYPNPGFPSPQAPVHPPATQNIAPQYFPEQSDSNLNYDGVQPEQQIPGNDQFPPQTDSNLQPVTFPPQIGPMNPQNGANPNEFQTFVPPQQTGAIPFPYAPLQTNPENSQVNSFSVGSETSAAPEVPAQGMDNVMLNPYQPSGVGQPEPQDVSTQDQFTTAVPTQFATESSGEVTTDYPDQYRPRPSEDNFSGVPGVQTTNQILTSIDEYQNPGPTTQEPLSYFQERPDDVAQTTPPPFQADQFLTSTQFQSEYVQNNAAMYSPNLAPRPQPQPSFDNLTEFPGDKTAGSTTQTPLPSEIKPETFGSQPPRQTALTETNIPDTDNTKTPDRQPNSGTSAYLGPQIYPNFDVPTPALNYPRQDRRSFPPTADSITRDMTYQTTVPAFTPSPTVPTYGINPIEMVFNSNSSYSSTAMIPGEGLEKQPFRQASALIASPQPQPTTVKYNEQIIIPQYQMPPASNQEPQASLKYADQNSGDNTKEGLLDSVAWTYPGPQEATGTVSQPQYQTTPLRSQFPSSNVENIGRPFLPGQKQPVPVSFEQEDSSNSKTTTKIVQEVLTTTDFPVEVESPSAEDKLARVDKLLNSKTRIQEYDQSMGQGPQIQFSPTETTAVTESFVTPTKPFQYPLAIQNQPQMQTSSLTRSEQIETNSSTSRPSPSQEDQIQVQPQFQSSPFSSTTSREVITDSIVTLPPPFESQTVVQARPQFQSLPLTNAKEGIADSPPLPLPQQINVQTQLQPYSLTVSRETITDSLVGQPPSFQPEIQDQPLSQVTGSSKREDLAVNPVIPPSPLQQEIVIQPRPQLQTFSSTIMKEETTVPPVPSIQPRQSQIAVRPPFEFQSFSSTNRRVGTTDSLVPPPPLEQQIDAQPQNKLQSFSTTSREVITDSFVTPPNTSQPQTVVQPQPQLRSFPSANTKEIIAESSINPPLPLPQQVNVQTRLQPYSLTVSRETITDSLVGQPPSFQPEVQDHPQPQIKQFDSTNIREDTIAPPFTTQPPFQQNTDVQPQTDLPSTNIKEVVATSSNLYPTSPFPKQIVQPMIDIQYPTTTMREDVTVPALTSPPSVQQPTQVQPQSQLQSFSSTNMREIIPDRDQPQLEEFDSTNIREDIAVPPVTPPAVFQQEKDQLQTEHQTFSSTISREVITDSLVTSQPPFQPQVQSQRQRQPLPSTNIKEVKTTTSVIPVSPFSQQIVSQPQTQLQYPTTIIKEDKTVPPVTLSSSVQQQSVVQSQPRLQSFPSTNMKDIVPDSPVIPPPQFPQRIDQSQTELHPFSSTISREVVTDSLVSRPPPFQSQFHVQSQPNLEGFDSTNIRQDVVVNPITPPPPSLQETDVQQQTELQPFSSTISREVVTDSLVSRPPPFQSQVQPQPNLEGFDSTNIREDVVVNPVTPPPPSLQETDVQQQTELRQFSATTSREMITDSLLSQPPPNQSQIVDRSQLQFHPYPSTNIRVDTTDSFVPPPPLQSQIQVQPQSNPSRFDSTSIRQVVTEPPVITTSPFELKTDTRPQTEPFSSTITKDVVTDTFVSPPLPLQAQTEDRPQSQVDEFDSTNIRKDITVPPVFSIPPIQPQIVVPPQRRFQSFSSTNRRVDTTDSLVPPPPFDQQIDAQPQNKLQPFSISREVITDSFVTPPFQPQTDVQPQPQLQSFPSANTKEIIAEPSINPPLPLPQQVNVQTRLQPYSLTISRETITDSLVGQPPPFQPEIQDQPQPQIKQFDSTNIREDTTALPIISASPSQQLTNAQGQPPGQAFPSTNMREITTNPKFSFVSPIQPQIQVPPQPNLEGFDSTNFTKSVTESRVITTPPFEQQTEVQSQTQLQPFSSTISREVITDSLVSRPPPFQSQPQIQFRPQPQPEELDSTNIREDVVGNPITPPPPLQKESVVQPFSATMSEEIVTDSLLTPPPPIQPKTVVQPQLQFQSFPVSNIGVVTTNSPVPPPPFQPQIQVPPQSNLESTFESTNIREVVIEPSVTTPPPLQQQNDAQPQTVLQPYSSSISRELITDSIVTAPPAFQPQIQVLPQQQFQIMSSTNTREDIADSPVTVQPVFKQQTNDLPQIQLKPFSSTMSKEIVTDSLVSQTSPLQRQNEVQSEPRFLPPSPNMRSIMSDSAPPVQQLLENQPQPALQLISSRQIMTGPLVSSPPPFPRQMEVRPQPELKTFSRVVPATSYVYPPTLLQQAVETQRQRDLRNFSSRNTTATVSDSPVGVSVALQGVREQVQNQMQAFPARNKEAAIAPLANPSAKLEKHVGRELQTQRTRYTTTKTKEVITESILPTSESLYAESGKDGQLKVVEIRSGPEGNRGKKTTEVVEETITTDFPPATEFSSLEDEFILADKLLNESTPILNTTSYVTLSPLGRKSEKVVTIVNEPADQISVNGKSENSVPLSMSTPVNYDPKYSQSGLANKPSSPLRGSTVSPDFHTSERDVLYTPAMSSDYQDDYEEASQWNPLLHTLETHLNFPLHEPSRVPSTTPGPRRASPLPLLSHFYPSSPTRRRSSWPNLETIKNSGSSGQEVKTGPRHDPPVPVFNPTDPSNGPDPLKELILKNHELVLKNSPNVMVAEPRSKNF